MTAVPLVAPSITLRKAVLVDVDAMSVMINGYAAAGLMLPRTPEELWGRLGEFMVAIAEDGAVAGCGGLRPAGSRRAEIVSLAVRDDLLGRGVGGMVLDRLMEDAGASGVQSVFARTHREGFFRVRGFRPMGDAGRSEDGRIVMERCMDEAGRADRGTSGIWSGASAWSHGRHGLVPC